MQRTNLVCAGCGGSLTDRELFRGQDICDSCKERERNEEMWQEFPDAPAPEIGENRVCDCGHTARWHGDAGEGFCEYDGECACAAFHWQMEPRR